MADELDRHVIKAAQSGDPQALEAVVRHVQDRVHALAVRMLVEREFALDAAQEILIRVVTKLSTFKGESSFNTWVYRVATNYLLTARKILARDQGLNFEIFSNDLLDGLADENSQAPEDHVMLNELRITCTMAMLLCLDNSHRIAYILGEIMELDQTEASAILGVNKDTYRKRLSRARRDVQDFSAQSCGLANSGARCSCPKRLPAAICAGRVGDGPSRAFSEAPEYAQVRRMAAQTEAALVSAKLQRASGPLRAPVNLAQRITEILASSGAE